MVFIQGIAKINISPSVCVCLWNTEAYVEENYGYVPSEMMDVKKGWWDGTVYRVDSQTVQ